MRDRWPRETLHRAVAVAAALLLAATCTSDSHAAARQSIWLHYDYMVAGDGTSYAPDPKGIDLVVQAFAAHGIDLHIDPQHAAIPDQHEFVEFDLPSPGTDLPGCQLGTDVVDFSTLRAEYFHPTSNHEWHYALFAPRICGGYSGFAQLPGDNFVVAMPPAAELGEFAPIWDGGTFMHELGHNLGLHHGGDVDANYKPNYLSVMNYFFQFGIPYAKTPGTTAVVGYRLDYSDQALPTLDENHLDERQGLGATGSTDISYYLDSLDDYVPVPASGPVDWNRDGVIEPDVRVELDPSPGCGSPCELMTGFDDWAEVHAYLAGQTKGGPRTVAIEPPSDQPLVTGISPATGPSTGGTAVTISGVHLKNVDEVSFGPCPATDFTVVNEHTITAQSPACDKAFEVAPQGYLHQGAGIDVTVAAGASLSPTSAGDQFTYTWPYPVVDSVSPATFFNSGGARVTIKGRNFTGTTEVDFDSSCGLTDPNRQPNFTVVDDHTIVIDPTVAVACPYDVGLYAVHVFNAYGNRDTTAFNFFTFTDPTAPPPTVSSVTPGGGPEAGGTPTVIRGSGFGSIWSWVGGSFCANRQSFHWLVVRFGSIRVCDYPAPVPAVFDDDTIFVTSPPGTGTVDVTAATDAGTSATDPRDQFAFGSSPLPPGQPQITAVSEYSAERGTALTITGTDLAPGPARPTVDFYGCLPVPATPQPDGTVSVTVPACAASGGTLFLSNEDGVAGIPAAETGSDAFTVAGGPPTVSITDFSPASGPPGTVVTISGDNIAYLPQVDFGCGYFEPTANPDGTLTATVPACAQTGPVEVNGPALDRPATSVDPFTVTP
jgi:hypothetical protein